MSNISTRLGLRFTLQIPARLGHGSRILRNSGPALIFVKPAKRSRSASGLCPRLDPDFQIFFSTQSRTARAVMHIDDRLRLQSMVPAMIPLRRHRALPADDPRRRKPDISKAKQSSRAVFQKTAFSATLTSKGNRAKHWSGRGGARSVKIKKNIVEKSMNTHRKLNDF